MTRLEFQGQFVRLCKGFKSDATEEQAEAWFRRIGHYALSVWAEAVTTCLCAKYFPKLDEALSVLETEADRQRAAAVQQERVPAKRIYTLIQSGTPPNIHGPLFQTLKAYAGLAQLERMQPIWAARLETAEEDVAMPQRRRLAGLTQEAARLRTVIEELMPKLEEADAAAVYRAYAPVVTT